MAYEEQSQVKRDIDEYTAQAMHTAKGFELEVCRNDAVMMQGLWEPKFSILGIITWLEKNHKRIPESVKQFPPTEAA